MASLSGGLEGAASGAATGAVGGPVGMAAGAIIGGLTGAFSGGGSNPNTLAQNSILGNIPKQIDAGNADTGYGSSLLGNAGRYYSTILGGNREAISNLLAPQVSTVLGQYDNAAKSIGMFAPRGGGTTQTLAQLPFQKTTATADAWQKALPGAAAGATSVGAQSGQLGTTLLGLGSGNLGGLLNSQQIQAARTAAQAGSAGQGLGKILANIMTKGGGGGLSGAGGPDTGNPDAGTGGDF